MWSRCSTVRADIAVLVVCLVVVCLVASDAFAAERTWEEPPKPAPLFDQRPAWPASHPTLCSDRRRLCVHTESAEEQSLLEPALRALERAYARIVDVIAWPAPAPDPGYGPNEAFDVYLHDVATPWTVSSDPLSDVGAYTRSSSFAVVDLKLAGSCAFDFALAAGLARAGIYSLDAAANHELANASAEYVATVVEPCADAFLAELEDFQVRPHLAISSPAHASGRGAMLFPWFLQETRGRGGPVDLLHALWVMSAQKGPNDAAIVLNEPDFMDAVAVVAQDRRRSLSDLLLDFAVVRAFVGNRDDGVHLPSSRFLGAAGAVRFEWNVSYASLPRRLAPSESVFPTGASYLWLSIEDAPEGSGLGFRAEWETPDVFRFALVIVDEQGQVLARYDPISPQRGIRVEANVEVLRGGAGVLIVACNTGSVLHDIAFDPDNHPYTPRSYSVSLFAQ